MIFEKIISWIIDPKNTEKLGVILMLLFMLFIIIIGYI